MNRYRPHVLIIPEDDANRQLANGFVLHHAIATRAVGVMIPAGGWTHVLSVFADEYVAYLRTYENAHIILLIDFDRADDRRTKCEQTIPADITGRVFVVGAWDEPEAAKRDVHKSLETIGTALAEECFRESYELWTARHFDHNDAERKKLSAAIRSIMFQAD
jgi:hypothetical protein